MSKEEEESTLSTRASEAPNLDSLPNEEESGAALQDTTKAEKYDYYQEYTTTYEDLPPYRINATRVPERLQSSHSSLMGNASSSSLNNNTGSSRRLSERSRSCDNDSISSLESISDKDILTDRMGLEELGPHSGSTSKSDLVHHPLPALNERMTEDTLEDVHAFSDVITRTTGSASSRANSIATAGDVGSLVLETLDEEEADGEEEEVYISNLDEITEEQQAEGLTSSSERYYFTGTEDLPPLRINACRVPDRLSQSHSSFFPDQQDVSKHSRGSRHKSVSDDGSISSIDDITDILTDRLGLSEASSSSHQRSKQLAQSLNCVNERLSDDTLDDVHAFSELQNKSMANSVATEEIPMALETLDEEEDLTPAAVAAADAVDATNQEE